MSFPMDQLTQGQPGAPTEGQMGDIIICPEVAAAPGIVVWPYDHEQCVYFVQLRIAGSTVSR